ncbi:MAG: DUF4093 domain-containing protein [Clostridia bacterium]|nr:DUF4093 domain-containing protein [Clostridia bacterium]
MTSEKPRVSLPIIVEGRYDKSTLQSIVDATVVTTDGFSVFNNKEKQLLLRKLSYNGVIVLTDSDGGGVQIRSFLQGIIPKEKIHNLYIPKREGKEKRKTHRSRAGLIGVEGMGSEVLLRLLSPFISTGEQTLRTDKKITKTDFYLDGLSGGEGASNRRSSLAKLCELPPDMSANALIEAMNLLYGFDGYKELIATLDAEKNNE